MFQNEKQKIRNCPCVFFEENNGFLETQTRFKDGKFLKHFSVKKIYKPVTKGLRTETIFPLICFQGTLKPAISIVKSLLLTLREAEIK